MYFAVTDGQAFPMHGKPKLSCQQQANVQDGEPLNKKRVWSKTADGFPEAETKDQ